MFNLNQQQNNNQPLLTPEQIEVRVWAFVVGVVTVILAGIVAFMLYSLAFVVQPIKSMAPIDQAFTKMLNDIILLIVGGIGGVMSKKGVQTLSENLAAKQTSSVVTAPVVTPPASIVSSSGMPNFNWMGYQNPDLDESWRPGPPPTTAPDYEHPEKEEVAHERNAAKGEAS